MSTPRCGNYPIKSLLFVFGSSVGQSYVSSGLQAILELYLIRFLLVCSRRSSSLGTTFFNLYVALYQLCSITGGLAADKLLGNYWTQIFSNLANTAGAILLALVTWQLTLSPPSCCHHDGVDSEHDGSNYSSHCYELMKEQLFASANMHFTNTVIILFTAFGLILFAIGYGQTNAIQSVFVANQFIDQQSSQMTHSFSWYYFFLNVGAFSGEAGLPILRQSFGFTIAFISIAGVSLLSTILFWAGSSFYVKTKPQRSTTESQPLLTSTPSTSFTVKQTLQQLWPIMTIFLPLIIYWALFFQQNSTWIQQGLNMDCYVSKLHIPPDMMASLEDVMVLIVIVAMEYIVYPHFSKTIHYDFPALHKLTIGMMCAAFSFIMAALLEVYLTTPSHDCRGRVNILWQLPQYLLIAVAEVLVSVTGLEFAYSQAPANMRNTVTALWYLCQALGSLLNAGIAQIAISRQWAFVMYSSMMWLLIIVFMLVSKRYNYKKPTRSFITSLL